MKRTRASALDVLWVLVSLVLLWIVFLSPYDFFVSHIWIRFCAFLVLASFVVYACIDESLSSEIWNTLRVSGGILLVYLLFFYGEETIHALISSFKNPYSADFLSYAFYIVFLSLTIVLWQRSENWVRYEKRYGEIINQQDARIKYLEKTLAEKEKELAGILHENTD